MPIRQVPGHADLSYYLLSYGADGVERTDDQDAPNGLLSTRIIGSLATTQVTDVFLISHGWLGDMPAAINQYDRWISAVVECKFFKNNHLKVGISARGGLEPGFRVPFSPTFHAIALEKR